MKAKYYIRIDKDDLNDFEEYMSRNKISYTEMGRDMSTTILLSVRMTPEEALSTKLAFRCVGFLNFNKVMDKQIAMNTLTKPMASVKV